jgi:hypothetical protein
LRALDRFYQNKVCNCEHRLHNKKTFNFEI